MNLEELLKQYVLCDGGAQSFHLDIVNRRATVRLETRRIISRNRDEPCVLELEFGDVTEIYLFEDFPTDGGYTDITLTTLSDGTIYFSLDPFGNSGEPNDQDNWIIRSSTLVLKEIQ